MSMSHNECLRVAEAIVAKYKAGKCIPSTVDYQQLLAWANDPSKVLQVRFNKINVDIVAEIVDRIRYFGNLDLAHAILVEKRKDGSLRLINGNHTTFATIEAIERKLVKGLASAKIAIIPDEDLPENEKDRENVLEKIALVMNRKEEVHNKTTKADIRYIIRKDKLNGEDIHSTDYQSALSASVQIDYRTIAKLVMEAEVELKEEELRKEFHFKQYSVAEMNYYRELRQAEFESKDESVAVTWAVVTRDKIYETLGKAVGNALNYGKAHIVFHFKTYSDTKLMRGTEQAIKAWMQHCKMELTYEFLPYKEVK